MTIKNVARAPTGSAYQEKAEILFREALQGIYGVLDWLPLADGAIHRFHVPGDHLGTCNGWYVLFADGVAAGAFGSWKAGQVHHWSCRGEVGVVEAEQMRQRVEQSRRQRGLERYQHQQQAAEQAQYWWSEARRADPGHSYLVAKQVCPHGLRQRGRELLVPLYLDGVLVNLQRIGADGQKRFLSGGRVKGCYSPLGLIAGGLPLCICEGWATGATLHAETGYPVACAMNAGNLLAVAQVLRARYPDADIVLTGDDDRQTKGNPGRTAANAAAAAIGGQVAFPAWPADAPLTLTDFNDLANWRAANEPT